MSVGTATSTKAAREATRTSVIHPAWVRITHWVNAVAMVLMIMSGWRIYNASPVFVGFTFPEELTIGGWLGGALQWHFAAMWLLIVNGLVYLTLGFVTGRFRRKLTPITAGEVAATLKDAATLKLTHGDLSKYNAVQKLLYVGVILAGVFVVLSGISIWKPVQFWWLTAIFGGYDFARVVHFMAMAAIVGFLVIHILLALVVPKSLRAMVVGR